jgi:DMSO/TMAO reductase YedYZ heme-binding membrane subunit
MYFLVAVEVTSLLRKKLSKRAWRLTHFLSFPLFALATFHLLWVGSDRTTPAMRVAVMVCVVAVCSAATMRVVQADQAEQAATQRVPTR